MSMPHTEVSSAVQAVIEGFLTIDQAVVALCVEEEIPDPDPGIEESHKRTLESFVRATVQGVISLETAVLGIVKAQMVRLIFYQRTEIPLPEPPV